MKISVLADLAICMVLDIAWCGSTILENNTF